MFLKSNSRFERKFIMMKKLNRFIYSAIVAIIFLSPQKTFCSEDEITAAEEKIRGIVVNYCKESTKDVVLSMGGDMVRNPLGIAYTYNRHTKYLNPVSFLSQKQWSNLIKEGSLKEYKSKDILKWSAIDYFAIPKPKDILEF